MCPSREGYLCPFYPRINPKPNSKASSRISQTHPNSCGCGYYSSQLYRVSGLLKKYWDLMEPEVCGSVKHFFTRSNIPMGCNSPFITSIPKVGNPILIYEYCLITLIGLKYKIIAKTLANYHALVADFLVGPKQSAFVIGC